MTSLLGANYDSSSDDETTTVPTAAPVVAAPDVSLEVKYPLPSMVPWIIPNIQQDPMQMQMMLAKPTDTQLTYNITYDNLSKPSQGPQNPFKPAGTLKRKNVLTGHAEETSISDATFTVQHRTFQSLGYTRDPTNNGYVGDLEKATRLGGRDVIQMRPTKADSEAIRRKRQKKGDPGDVDEWAGPWAKYQNDIMYEDRDADSEEELASDEEYVEEEEDSVVPSLMPAGPKTGTDYASDVSVQESSKFHGSEQFDYQGRTYMHIPQDLDIDLRAQPDSVKNYVPKKLIHTWKEHTAAVTALRFFPSAGHLLLSASADSTVKIYDIYRHNHELLRTFSGHSRGLTDAQFAPLDGKTFLSSSYDRYMKLWDTETGTCISKFTTGKIPHCLAFNPDPANASVFLAGMSDKKIVQYDVRSGELTQEYDHHLGPVNTLTFVDNARRFLSTSDDRSLLAWEFDIPVPIKRVAEPDMFAMSRACPHPSGKYVAFQAGNNEIHVYAATDRFRQNKKKAFRGHNTAGYGVDVSISPDGGLIASGDAYGYAWFWDWKTGRQVQKLSVGAGGDGKKGAGKKAVTCVQWHPQETSKVATAGEDGTIRYWD
ncbi:MAG: hypothetical protein M1834_003661 [Cirrosporium novae-zelandiae]|nr:MAG: hypothetical protein M1834_003661 [Cirrosporium novae-zelandiae]